MKRPFFASVALATLITAPAIAADLPRPVPAPPLPSAFPASGGRPDMDRLLRRRPFRRPVGGKKVD